MTSITPRSAWLPETPARQGLCIGNDVQDEEWFDVQCGRCGRRLRLPLIAIQDARTIDCADCVEGRDATRAEDNLTTDADLTVRAIGYELPRRIAQARNARWR